jgi:hypothetical protein
MFPESIHEMDSFVAHSQQSLSVSSQSEPLLSPFLFWSSRDSGNTSSHVKGKIFHLTESIPTPSSWLEHGAKILQALSRFLLAFALRGDSKGSKQPEDTSQISSPSSRPASYGFLRHAVTLLVDVLAELGAGADIVVRNIEEMAILCQEHLTLQWTRPTRSVILFARVLHSKITFYLLVPD